MFLYVTYKYTLNARLIVNTDLSDVLCIMQYNILTATPSFITSGLILAIYYVQYLQAIPYFKNKIPCFLLKPYQNHIPFRGRYSIPPNALNLEKIELQIRNFPLSLDLL